MNLEFTLTQEQEATSMMMYGKIMKCIIAPYHSYNDLGPYVDKSTYLFPERDISYHQSRILINSVKTNAQAKDIFIITSNMNIIQDMVDDCIRILTEDGKLVSCPEKTLAANIHTIRYDLLENENHQSSKVESLFHFEITNLIDEIEKATDFTKEEYEKLKVRVELVGEEIIRHKLSEMLRAKRGHDDQTRVDYLEEEIERLKKLKAEKEKNG